MANGMTTGDCLRNDKSKVVGLKFYGYIERKY